MNLAPLRSKIASAKSRISGKLKKNAPGKNIPQKKAGKIGIEWKSVSEYMEGFSYEKPGEQRFAILGIGNDLKGDDGIGFYVIDRLKKGLGNDKNLLLVKTSVPENHIKEINDFTPGMLIIIDSADFKKSPGQIKSIKGYQISESFVSTHTTPLTVFLRLYQDQPFKKPLIVIGIQRKSNEFGQPMSRPVKKAGDNLAKLISGLYKKNALGLSLEKELEYLSDPLKKVRDYFKKEEKPF